MNIAKAAAAEPGIGATVSEAPVTKACTASPKAAAKAAKTTAVEAPKPPRNAIACSAPIARHMAVAVPANSARTTSFDPLFAWSSISSWCYFAAATVANGIFCVPGGSSGVNTGSAMRGAKSQSLKTAVNCGCAGWFL